MESLKRTKQLILSDLESELINSAYISCLMMQQLFSQAQTEGFQMTINIGELENRFVN